MVIRRMATVSVSWPFYVVIFETNIDFFLFCQAVQDELNAVKLRKKNIREIIRRK